METRYDVLFLPQKIGTAWAGSAACSVGDRQSHDSPEQPAVAGKHSLPGSQKPGKKVSGPSLTPKESVGDRFPFFFFKEKIN